MYEEKDNDRKLREHSHMTVLALKNVFVNTGLRENVFDAGNDCAEGGAVLYFYDCSGDD